MLIISKGHNVIMRLGMSRLVAFGRLAPSAVHSTGEAKMTTMTA